MTKASTELHGIKVYSTDHNLHLRIIAIVTLALLKDKIWLMNTFKGSVCNGSMSTLTKGTY